MPGQKAAPNPRLSSGTVGVLAACVLLAVELFFDEVKDHPDLHTILDTSMFLLSALIALWFWDRDGNKHELFAKSVAVSFGLTSLAELVHTLFSLHWEWALIAKTSESLRPATWPPAAYVLPTGLCWATWRLSKFPRNAAPFTFAISALTLLLFGLFRIVPRYTSPSWFGITRPTLVLVPILWSVVLVVARRNQSREPVLYPISVLAIVLVGANSFMLYSRAPHDSAAMVAHLGSTGGYLAMLLSLGQLASRDAMAFIRSERGLFQLNEDLENRIRQRTADLEAVNMALQKEVLERQQASIALEEGEKRWAAIIGSATDSIITIDEQQRIMMFNSAAEKMLRCHSSEVLGQNVSRFIPLQFRAAHGGHIRSFAATGVSSRSMGSLGSLRAVRADGQEFPIEASISQIVSGGKKFFTVILRDITLRQQAEDALCDQAQILDETQIMVRDLEGRISMWTRGAERLYGFQREEAIGRISHELLKTEFPEPLHELDAQLMRAGSWEGELIHRRKDGSTLNVASVWLLQGQGSDQRVVETNTDITELKRIGQDLQKRTHELTRSNRDLEQFAYAASHDLQEPLRAVAGCVQLLRSRYQASLDARADELIAHAVDGAARMKRLIDDLLTFSRVNTHGAELDAVDCNIALKEAVRNLSMAIDESGAKLVQENSLPLVFGDEPQLALLFQNLIGNALKFRSQRKPVIQVNAARIGTRWEIAIADNGIGIDPQYFDRIFIIFQRLHTRSEYPGTGMGLALCKKIVERHGGTIWVDSTIDQGTTFHFTLRAATAALPSNLQRSHAEANAC
jgi:PAS domain S-box-containing protein